MNEDQTIREVSNMVCPACNGPIEFIKDIQNPQPVRKGNIVVCGHCATILKIGDSNLIRCSQEEVKGLDSQSRALIAQLVMGVLQKKAKDSGRKFKPKP